MPHFFYLAAAIFSNLLVSPCWAMTPQDFLSLDTGALTSGMIQSIAIGTAHRPFMPATPLSLTRGFELGISLSAVSLAPNVYDTLGEFVDFKGYPPLLPIPTLLFRKGLYQGVNLGISGMAYREYYFVGGDLQLSYPPRIDRPTVALRLSTNYLHLPFMTARTHSFDVVLSQSTATANRIFSTDPYLGLGLLYTSGSASIPLPSSLTGFPGIPTEIQGSVSGTKMRVFVGFPLRISVLNLTPEYSYTDGNFHTYGLKLSILIDDSLFSKSGGAPASNAPNIGWEPPPLW